MLNFIQSKLGSYDFKKYNLSIFMCAILLALFGAYTLYAMPGVSLTFVIKQLIGVFVGIVGAFIVSLIDYRFIAKFYVLMYVGIVGMLGLVKFTKFGINKYGATRWLGISIGGREISFQPAEVAKLVMIIVLAKGFEIAKNQLKGILALLVISAFFAVPLLLVLIEPDLSTSIVILICYAVITFSSGYSLKVLLAILAILVPLGIFGIWYVQQPDPLFITKTQQGRILSFLHPEEYPDLVYQQANAISAISSGGLLGKTLTNDTGIRGTTHVPVSTSDFIFTGVGEEFGFLGSVIVILLFVFLTISILKIAVRAEDLLGKLIAVGVGTLFMSQAFVNIGVVTMILPNTGIPLPFMSNGLSSAAVSYFMLGMVQNIAINQKPKAKHESEDYIE